LYLKKLDIFGFKSFAHKLSLDFGPGITCVVGPNGCGKTNVADAIRWVLGEQSPTELRGSSMADVIFNGTKQRRRLGMAEVTLAIDNSEGYLPTDFSEVVIGRRVFRSGESEYTINKTSSRLRDVRDLFMDTGIGTRTYSLIERKMVDSVLSDSTGHRRFMFEEAAGIMKYKVRKRSALNKLEATEADMQRVSDIITEVDKQVRSLMRQLAQARRHRRYTDGLRDLEIRLARVDYARWRGERAESQRRASELRAALEGLSSALQSGEHSGLGIKSELRDKEEALASLDLEIGEIEGRARDLTEALLVSRERRSASERRVTELDAELADIRADLSQAVKRAQDLEDEIRVATESGAEKERELEARVESRKRVDGEHRRLKDLLDGQKQTRIEGLESSAGIKGELESYRARLDDLALEHVAIERALAEARAGLAAMEQSHAARSREKEALRGLDRAREELSDARERRTRLAGELEAARHKAELLAEIRDGYGGYQDGVRALFSGEAGGLEGLVGTVADLIDVDSGMEAAVEAALEGASQYVVVRDVGCARSAMDHLMAGSLGRATFIPLEDLRALPLKEASDRVLSTDGVVGPAARFVRFRGEHPGLAAFLLEGVVVVRDLEVALRMAADPEARELIFVTPAGDAATATGVLTGGRPGNEEAGLLRRTERLEASRREVESLSGRLAEAVDREKAAAGGLEAASGAATAAEAERERAEAALWEAKRGVTELELSRTNLAEKAAQLAANRDALAARMDSTRSDVEGLAKRLDQLSRGEDELGARLDELAREFRAAERAAAKAAEDEKQSEIEAAAARSTVTRLKGERVRLAETVRGAGAAIEKKTDEREEHVRAIASLGEAITRDSRAADELQAERRALEGDRDAMRAAAHGLRGRIETIEEEARGARGRKDETQRELHEIELADTELRGRCEALTAKIREDYSIDLDEAGPEAPAEGEAPFDERVARQEVERLKARLRSMGPVNLLALDEYDEESKRLEFLRAQYEDLERSKEALKEAIERINQTATRMFVETFEKVRSNFIETFQRLFEGGEADLRFDDPSQPLESPIEIVASPRGKRLGRLSLLSGGERALTAIALLFAIYLVKPSPFCILDEVDAPLDDANVERFVRMLREFSERTQFIIITHNKATMQAGDRLYGITMEESGVSKVVSVRLDAAGGEVRSEEAVLEAA
jgi:chromosome segregation protein